MSAGGVLADVGQFRRGFRSLLGRVEQLLQVRTAPTAAGARAKALAHLTRPLRLVHPQKVEHLSLGDVKAQAKFVVKFHWSTLPLSWRGRQSQRGSTGLVKVGDVQPLRNRVRIDLAAAQRDRRNAARAHPVGVQAAVGDRPKRFEADAAKRRFGGQDRRLRRPPGGTIRNRAGRR